MVIQWIASEQWARFFGEWQLGMGSPEVFPVLVGGSVVEVGQDGLLL